jgi:hypothetical protein
MKSNARVPVAPKSPKNRGAQVRDRVSMPAHPLSPPEPLFR